MERYIEVSNLPNFEVTCSDGKKYILLPFEHLYDIPAADVVELKRGEWSFHDLNGVKHSKCSCCGTYFRYPVWKLISFFFCPACGCDMRGEQDDE